MTNSRNSAPELTIHVTESGVRAAKGVVRCRIGENVRFSTESIESYFFAKWEPIAYDALLVAAAVEFADRTVRRPAHTWKRSFNLTVPVHDPDRWNQRRVKSALHDALTFLTGDCWSLEFHGRRKPLAQPQQNTLALPTDVEAVIPFSNGLDSRAVAGLMGIEMGSRLVRIRLGTKLGDSENVSRQAFTAVPYQVKSGESKFVESTARSRGFKFALISGLAAFLAGAEKIIVPESGQGALGPALVTVGQSYEDYRSHPLFTRRMQELIAALLGHRVLYVFPQLWSTKAETLRRFVDECKDSSWLGTWSCWQQNRHVSVEHKKRQCGICAACMLRRLSIHAARLSEPPEHYVWEDLSATTFADGAAAAFPAKKITRAMREYAIAGALHLDHLAALTQPTASGSPLSLAIYQLSTTLGLPESEIQPKLQRMLKQHASEWKDFMNYLGQNSFVADWALSGRS